MIQKKVVQGYRSGWMLGAAALALAWLCLFGAAQAKGPLDGQSATTIALSELPVQGREDYALILKGGPFKYDKDGVVFGNRERILPQKSRGYYHEYTVKTPSSKDRGPKRIVCGGNPPSKPEVCYYTDDHYNSFRKIVP